MGAAEGFYSSQIWPLAQKRGFAQIRREEDWKWSVKQG